MATAKKKPTVAPVAAKTAQLKPVEVATEPTPTIDMDALKIIVDTGEDGCYTPESVHTPLEAAGLVEVNSMFKDAEGNLATRATAKGFNMIKPQVVETGGFVIDNTVPVPEIKKRGRTGQSRYPFEAMEVGDSFFVPATTEKPEPSKTMASTVSTFIRKYSYPDPAGAMRANKLGEPVPVMIKTRDFIVRAVTENEIEGARIWRIK